MKKVLFFAALLTIGLASCKKKLKPTRSAIVYCTLYQRQPHLNGTVDTVVAWQTWFHNVVVTPQALADSLNTQFQVTGYWYECNY